MNGNNTIKVLIEGKKRAKINTFFNEKEGYFADIEECEDEIVEKVKIEASVRSLKNIFRAAMKMIF